MGDLWIGRTFQKRDCIRFMPSSKDLGKCCCGQVFAEHEARINGALNDIVSQITNDEHWNSMRHTLASQTNAYGTIEFQGSAHPLKAQYVRVSFDTKPEQLLELLLKQWHLELPKLLVSVHGGKANFDLQPKLKSVLQKGLVKAAKTTGAWIFTGGTNTGVMKHVGEAIQTERSPRLREQVITMGIAPWGIVENRKELLGHNVVVPYYSISSPKSRFSALNNHHSYFLLSDNGTVGRYGAEIAMRKKLERHISKQQIYQRFDNSPCGVPVVCVVIEGGLNTIRTVLEYVTDNPPVPVVICDGSGRSADLLAFAHKYLYEDDPGVIETKKNVLRKIEEIFEVGPDQSEQIYVELLQCVCRRDLITVFRMGDEDCEELDQAILTALLNGHRLAKPDQLGLALTWNRCDLALREVFVYGVDWPTGSLEQAMMDALLMDRVDFVKLLLENGVNMSKFLTIARLEELYNTRSGPSNTLQYLVRDVKKHAPKSYRYQLYDIGLVIEKLMGGAYQSYYCRREFRQKYYSIVKVSPKLFRQATVASKLLAEKPFKNPFNELLIWAVLMKRQKMAVFMWKHGEEAIVKALVACRLYRSMAQEAAEDDLETEIFSEMMSNAKEFETYALELLDYCYRQDDDLTLQLLTHELQNWSKQTCLSIAIMAHHNSFLAHPGAQMLVADLWLGGLRIRKTSNLKVILGLFFPLAILTMRFKTKEELELMPQTEEEHRLELEDDGDTDSIKSDSEMFPTYRETPRIGKSLPGINNKRHQFTLSKAESNRSLNRAETGKPESPENENNENSFAGQKHNPLKLGKKIYEFYAAPITKFWGHAMAYVLFLCVFTYLVLIRLPLSFTWYETYVVAYHATFGVEKLREILFSEPKKVSYKLKVWAEKKWNPVDLFVIIFFFIGVTLRCEIETIPQGRVFYTLSIMYWYLRFLDILSVNKYLGPFVTMIGKMVVNMLYFVVLLLLVMMSYGVARQALLNPNEEPSWMLVRHIFFMPYWMLYGEVFADSINAPCVDGENDSEGCQTGAWLNPAIMAIYLLISNILLVNLLIAVFNNIFMEVSSISQELWKSQRYRVVIEYEQKPVLPPPLIIISHAALLFKYCRQRWKGKIIENDHGLKLFLDNEALEKLNDFEEECVDGYLNERENALKASVDELTRVTASRVDLMMIRVDDVNEQQKKISQNIDMLKARVRELQECLQFTVGSSSTLHDSQKDLNDNAPEDSAVPQSILKTRKPSSHRRESSSISKVSAVVQSPDHLNAELIEDDNISELPKVLRSPSCRARARIMRAESTKRQISLPKDSETLEREGSLASHGTFFVAKTRGKSMSDVDNNENNQIDDSKIWRSNSTMSHRFANRQCKMSIVPNKPHRRQSYGDNNTITDEMEENLARNLSSSLTSQGSGTKSCTFEHEQAVAMENELLHGAEEADYHLMEGLIQRRLRRDSENLTMSLEELCSIHTSSDSSDNEINVVSHTTTTTDSRVSLNIIDGEENGDQRARSPHLLHPNWNESKF